MRTSSLVGVFLLLAFANAKHSHREPVYEALSKEIIDFVNNKANTTWRAGPSKRFTSITQVRQHLGTVPRKGPSLLSRKPVSTFIKFGPFVSFLEHDLPTEFDARNHWKNCKSIGLIRDQSNCGSCWAFGAVEAMSDRICIASLGKLQPILSAEDMLECCQYCGAGCNGGYPEEAWDYWHQKGIVTGGLYQEEACTKDCTCKPYSFHPCSHHVNGSNPPCSGEVKTPSCSRTCRPESHLQYNENKYYGEEAYTVSSDEDEIKKELFDNGPMEVAFEVYADFLSYQSGVYQHVHGIFHGGHAVRLIGWGEENGVPYWLIANSWNIEWGEQGCFKIKRGTNECGIESQVVAGLADLNRSPN